MTRYQDLKRATDQDVYDAIERDDPEELLHVPISVSMSHGNLEWAQDICLQLAEHADPQVRGNAVLGFGHLARRFGVLDKTRVLPVLETALREENRIVAGQAWAAADDVAHFIGWEASGFSAGDS